MPEAPQSPAKTLEDALSQGDHRAVEHVIMSNVWPLYSWHYELLIEAVSSLPTAVLERNQFLKILHPLTPVLARMSRPYFPMVTPDTAKTLTSDQLDLLVLAQMMASRISGDEESSIAHAKRLTNRIQNSRNTSREHPDGPLWYFHLQIGSTYLAAGSSSRALTEFAVSRQLAALTSLPDAERLVLGRAALTHAVRGSLSEAERALLNCRSLASASPAHRAAAEATENVADALVQAERLSAEASEALSRLEPFDSFQMTWAFALLARTRYLNATRHPDEALEIIHLTRETHPTQQGNFVLDVYESATIDALIANGEITEAAEVARSSLPHKAPLTHLALVRLALHSADLETATRQLREVETSSKSGVGLRIEVALLTAWVQFARAGSLDEVTAARVLQYGLQTRNRRLFSYLPIQLIEEVKSFASEAEAASLTATLSGLSHGDLPTRPKLTNSELRVLQALAQHQTTASIAKSFFVSPNTIKSHLQSLYRKLGCSTREQAVQEALRLGLVTRTSDVEESA
ncbi:MAG: LuxR C-terminal-related transcriptional regulator [Leucobacter sp.]